jgi:acetyl-CoA/propionyl-CoA carboxylase biotin carboxyl carrier protein
MLAKIIAWGPDRAGALDRLAHALDETVVLGLTTNLRFLRWLVRQPAVVDGNVRTDALERIWPPAQGSIAPAIPEAAWSTAAALLTRQPDGVAPTSDAWGGGWRVNGAPVVRVSTDETAVAIAPRVDPTVVAERAGDAVHVDIDGRSIAIRLAAPPDVDRAARAAAGHHGGAVELVAPMPGRVRTIEGAVGGPVAAGDPVVVLEAMKMEHAVNATVDGRLVEVRVVAGDQVVRGQVLAVVEP